MTECPNSTGKTNPPAPLGHPTTGIADALVADLRDLAGELAGQSFTTSSVSMLHRDLRLTVRSLLGFSITMTVLGPSASVAINVVEEPLDPTTAGDSLAIELPPRDPGMTASVAIYAAAEHGLDDLREDLSYALDLPVAALTISPSTQALILPGITGLDDFLQVHQALGVLLSRGHTHGSAGVELIRQAHGRPGGLVAAAQALLDGTTAVAHE